MTTRVVTAAIAAATTPLSLVPVHSAWAQVEHAQRLALEVAIRRAQVRTLVCGQPYARPVLRQERGGEVTSRLPPSPPVGTAGPVDCSRPAWPHPLGR